MTPLPSPSSLKGTKKALSLCGSVSGRDRDKISEAGLTACFVDGAPAFEEASLVFVCKKMYHGDLFPENFDAPENDEKWYPEKDYHTMYIGEILKGTGEGRLSSLENLIFSLNATLPIFLTNASGPSVQVSGADEC